MNPLPGLHGKRFPVRKIIGAHIDENNKTFYQVQWEPSWEPAQNLQGCESLIKDFWLRYHPIAHIKQETVDPVSAGTRKLSDSTCSSTTVFGKTPNKIFGLAYPPRRTSRIGTSASHRFIKPPSYSPATSGSMAGYLTRRQTRHSVSKSETYQLSMDDEEASKTPSFSYSARSESDSMFSSERGSVSEETLLSVNNSFFNDRVLAPMDSASESRQKATSSVDNNSRNLKPFSCHICSFRACEKVHLLRHYVNRHSLRRRDVNIVFPCPVCQRWFKGKTYLISHLETHPEPLSKPYCCSICKMSYESITDLECHHLSHEFDLTADPDEETQDYGKPKERTSLHQCQKCSLGFESLGSLQRHQRRHIETIGGTNPPLEPGSGSGSGSGTATTSTSKVFTFRSKKKMTTKKSNLSKVLKREKTNREENQNKVKMRQGPLFLHCPYCPSQFSNKNFNGITNLNIHLVLKHKDTVKAKPRTHLNKCPKCVKMFTSKGSLDVHLVKKHDIRPVKASQEDRKSSPKKRKDLSRVSDPNKSEPDGQSSTSSSNPSQFVDRNSLKPGKMDRKARMRKILSRKRAQFKSKVIVTRNRSQSPVKPSSSSTDKEVPKTLQLNPPARRCRTDNKAPKTSQSNPAFRKRGRPPGIAKVIAGRIIKKYRCPHCHLTYIHLPSFNTHQKICKSIKINALHVTKKKVLKS